MSSSVYIGLRQRLMVSLGNVLLSLCPRSYLKILFTHMAVAQRSVLLSLRCAAVARINVGVVTFSVGFISDAIYIYLYKPCVEYCYTHIVIPVSWINVITCVYRVWCM